jgi:hypothetical protein
VLIKEQGLRIRSARCAQDRQSEIALSKRIDIEYRRYRIIASDIKGKPAAVAIQSNSRLFETSAATVQDAVQVIKKKIDDRIAQMARGRRELYIATTPEYIEALRALRIGLHEHAMLRAHAQARSQTLTAGELAQAAGYSGYESANNHYGKLGRRIAEFLDLTVPIAEKRKQPIWTFSLADGVDQEEAADLWRWRMHPELVAALRELNLA